jgi:hypothetical protein
MIKQTPEATKRYRDKHRELINNKIKEYSKLPEVKAQRRLKHYLNPVNIIYYAAKSRAKKKSLDFNIDKSDIIIPDFCPVLEIPIFVCKGKSGNTSPTLDRSDNSKGYVKGNVRVISGRANTSKGDMSIEDIERLLAYAKGEL